MSEDQSPAVKCHVFFCSSQMSIWNLSFAGNTDSTNQIQTRPKIKFFQFLSSNLIFQKSTTDQQQNRGRKKSLLQNQNHINELNLRLFEAAQEVLGLKGNH